MRMRKPGLLLLGAAIVIVGSFLSVMLRERGAARPTPPDRPGADTAIAFWAARVRQNPSSYLDYLMLGEAYNRKARATGGVDFYLRAEAAFREALIIHPGYAPATAALAGARFAVHDFEGALALAAPLVEVRRLRASALALTGDAQFALGRYAESQSTYQQLAQLGSNASVSTRLAFVAEVYGEPEEALALMQQAADQAWQAGDYRENLAWYEYQAGELFFKTGSLDQAWARYQAALDVFPGYYLALGGLGQVRAAQGRLPDSIAYYERAVAVVPEPSLLAALGDLYSLAGRGEDARRQYATVEFIGQLAQVNQQVYNRQLALFYADHDLQLETALALALGELEVRQDVMGYDAAAWAYYKNGLPQPAQRMMAQAMRLGTRDARLYYHAGLIARALGQTAEAERLLSEALRINPYFDPLQARQAHRALEGLRAQAN